MKMSQKTKERIARWGKFGDSQEDALNRALDLLERYEKTYGVMEENPFENAIALEPITAQ